MTTEDSYREAIVQSAAGELGSLDHHVAAYWEACGLTAPFPLAWCGAFALSRLKAAGCAQGIDWMIGHGFLLVAPHALREVATPKPGDVSYKPQPFQHHAVVERVEDGIVHTIDGNQGPPLYIKRASHPIGVGHVYFDVTPLIPKSDTIPSPPPPEPE
jgi:hypothetical protein